ncbi:MAG TPA: NapC/NirT family cytochrome c [Kofleriaceae bacterium]|nr:NapC/NirT family cytochrome c [Kofleriaceae bacterium]
MFSDPFKTFAIGSAVLSMVLLLWFFIRRPALTRTTKIVLLFGIGVFPLATAGTGNISGYNATKATQFCGSCHVMTPYSDDSTNLESTSLAARHARNDSFGKENCYACHADYGMYGTITTKIGGMRHVYEYVFNYRDMPLDQFLVEITIRAPFRNETCMHCHSTQNPLFNTIGDHVSTRDDIRSGKTSCASEGCHGPAHPFSKDAKKRHAALTEVKP